MFPAEENSLQYMLKFIKDVNSIEYKGIRSLDAYAFYILVKKVRKEWKTFASSSATDGNEYDNKKYNSILLKQFWNQLSPLFEGICLI